MKQSNKPVLGYYVERESWHYEHTRLPREDDIVLMVGMYAPRGGGEWEFSITEENIQGGCLRVRVFDDSWAAFTEAPEFFAGLAALGKNTSVQDVVGLMDRLGFRDFTQRTQPNGR